MIRRNGGKRRIPERRNSNTWDFADSGHLACETVFRSGQSFMLSRGTPEARRGNHVAYPAVLTKTFYFMFLSGCRQQEIFKKPYPTINLQTITEPGKPARYAVLLTHINEKHGMDPSNPTMPKTIPLMLPIFDEYELAMWNYITDGGVQTRAESIFRYDLWRSTGPKNIHRLIKTNFKADLRSPLGKVYYDHGITPHILRHMRAYNLLINHNVPEALCMRYMGWNSRQMLYYYAHIERMMQTKDQLSMLKQSGLLTDYRIDAAARMLR